MKKYCVAVTWFSKNNIELTVVDAESFFDAFMYAGYLKEDDRSSCETIDEIKDVLFYRGMMTCAVEI